MKRVNHVTSRVFVCVCVCVFACLVAWNTCLAVGQMSALQPSKWNSHSSDYILSYISFLWKDCQQRCLQSLAQESTKTEPSTVRINTLDACLSLFETSQYERISILIRREQLEWCVFISSSWSIQEAEYDLEIMR